MWLVMVGINDFSHMATGRSAIYKPRAWYRTFRYRRPTLWDSPTRPIHRNLYCWNVLENLRKRMKLAFKGQDWVVYQDARAEWYDDYCKKRWHAPKTDTLPDLAPMLKEYEQNMMSILGHSKRFGIAVVATTQPALYQQSMPEEFKRITYGGGPLAELDAAPSSAAVTDRYV